MITHSTPPDANWLLAALGSFESEPLLSELQLISLRHGQTIYDVGAPLTKVYFPIRSTLSLRSVVQSSGVEVAVVDKRSYYGYFSCRELTRSLYEVVVESPGEAYCIDFNKFWDELRRNPLLSQRLEVERKLFLATVSLAAACCGLHTVSQRLCRRLLEAADRVGSNELRFTHEFIARALGVRRPSVSEAMVSLEAGGIISNSRKNIRIIDVQALEQRSCECYRALGEARQRKDGESAFGVK